MKDGPVIFGIASLIGDPARANMLESLIDGRALTVTELSDVAGVTIQTTSGHLAKLEAAGLVEAEKQGRHRYFRLSGQDVADILEKLMGLAVRTGATRVHTGPKDAAMRSARLCYDHLAGERGVAMFSAMETSGYIVGSQSPRLTETGRAFVTEFGVDLSALERSRRPLCRACLDWSERRSHLAGSVGAAMLDAMFDKRWARHDGGRVVTFSPTGAQHFDRLFPN
ncbi:MAG: helix-turn-helix transcriptional regulator [Mesorhizobium sp.]